jgi:hypothetical protein
MHRLTLALALWLGASSLGCAARPAPLVVRAGAIGDQPAKLAPGQSLVIEFQPGDEIPLDVSVDGPLVRSPKPAEPVRLKVVRRFFLRVDEDGIATSLDGVTFGDHIEKGAFRFGVGATKEKGVTATIAIRTPTPREPGG